jgi:hypothetical protein
MAATGPVSMIRPAYMTATRCAVSATTALSRPPPKGFPDRFIVRFDVVTEADASGIATP